MYASETHFYWLADSLPQLVWTVDAQGRVSYGNSAWYAHTGIGAGCALTDRYLPALHPQDRPLWSQVWEQSVACGEPYAVERRIRFGSDSNYVQQVEWGRPIRDEAGRTGEWLVIATDADDNERMIGQLQRSLDRKDNWLASLAHEMRSPLAPLLNAVQVLHRHGDEPVVVNQSCATLTRQVARLVRLVDDLFELIDVENARLFLARAALDLEAVVAGAIQTAQPALAARGHQVEVQSAPGTKVVEGDWRRLSRVFVNLLADAARHTGDGGRILVLIEREPDWVLVKVCHTGAGIPRKMLPHMFDAYVRVERGSCLSKEGPGLHLALARHLVELHGGTISVLSDGIGRGSEFTVRLPAARKSACPEHLTQTGRPIAVM
jgi:signal transduction histidine kinase